MRIRRLNHSAYQLRYHVVWGTKFRYKCIIPVVKQEFLRCIYDEVEKYPTLHIFFGEYRPGSRTSADRSATERFRRRRGAKT